MRTFTQEQVDLIIGEAEGWDDSMPSGAIEKDNHGQLIIYTGIFEWRDGSYHDEPEKSDAETDAWEEVLEMSDSSS